MPDFYLALALLGEFKCGQSPLTDLMVAEIARRVEYGVEIQI